MIEDAEARGKLKPGMEVVVVEPTSGNTGIGLAMVCAVKGYKLVLTMPENFSVERRKLLSALGAELVLTPRAEGMQGAVDCAKGICKERPNAFMPQQFDNPANPKTHMETTAQEILREIPNPDAFVAGVGTGGTITGVGRAFRARNLKTLIVAVEPASSPLLSGGKAGPHALQGLGANFIPSILDRSVIDQGDAGHGRGCEIDRSGACEEGRNLCRVLLWSCRPRRFADSQGTGGGQDRGHDSCQISGRGICRLICIPETVAFIPFYNSEMMISRVFGCFRSAR